MVVQIEAAEAAKKEAEKAKKRSKKVVGKGGDSCKGGGRRDTRRSERSRSRETFGRRGDYDRATLKSQSGSVALIIRPVRGRACLDQQRLISTEEGLVYTSPVASRGPLSPDQINISKDTTWKYKKVQMQKLMI